MNKKVTGFNVEKSSDKLARPSVFDRLVKEIDPTEIPAKYIQYIQVHYHDGTSIELKGEEISQPMPVNKNMSAQLMEESMKKIKDVKLFLKTDLLENDINLLVEEFLGRHC